MSPRPCPVPGGGRYRRAQAAAEVAAVRARCQPIRPQAGEHRDERSVQPKRHFHVGATAATGSRPHPFAHGGVGQ